MLIKIVDKRNVRWLIHFFPYETTENLINFEDALTLRIFCTSNKNIKKLVKNLEMFEFVFPPLMRK